MQAINASRIPRHGCRNICSGTQVLLQEQRGKSSIGSHWLDVHAFVPGRISPSSHVKVTSYSLRLLAILLQRGALMRLGM